ncbi:MAG: hypothetical protein AB1714_21165 [Acidobacteriota bacterium]
MIRIDNHPLDCYLLLMRRREWSGMMAVAAALCLISLFVDLSANAECDLLPISSGAAGILGLDHADGAKDPCAARCVPDCACCTPSLVPGGHDLDCEPEPITSALLHAAGKRTLTGVPRIPYRPPTSPL